MGKRKVERTKTSAARATRKKTTNSTKKISGAVGIGYETGMEAVRSRRMDLPVGLSQGNDLGDMVPHGFVTAAEDSERDAIQPLNVEAEKRRDRIGVLLSGVNANGNATGTGPGAIRLQEIIDGDDREPIISTRTYPFRAVCRLIAHGAGGAALGTGWMAGPNLVMTAGHNLFDNHLASPGRWID